MQFRKSINGKKDLQVSKARMVSEIVVEQIDNIQSETLDKEVLYTEMNQLFSTLGIKPSKTFNTKTN